MGINVVEAEEAERARAAEAQASLRKKSRRRTRRGNAPAPAKTEKAAPGERTDDPVRIICARWARSSCLPQG